MTDKLELKSSHEVIYTVDVADVDNIFHGKPIDPDILTVVMKDGKRLYCDEVCPVDSLQEDSVHRTKADVDAAMQDVEEKSKAFTEAHQGEDADTILAQMRGEEPLSKDLEEEIEEYWKNAPTGTVYFPMWEYFQIIAHHFAEWGKKQSEIEMHAQSMALAHGCPKEKPANEDLEEAAKNHAVERYRATRDMVLAEKCKWSFKEGAMWNKRQLWKDMQGDNLPMEYVKYQLELRLPETLVYNDVKVERKNFIKDFMQAIKDE